MSQIKKTEAIQDYYAQELGEMWLPQGTSDIKFEDIIDLPVLITKDGTIVCIPHLPEMGLIAEVGMPGMAKSLNAGFLVGNIFYNWKEYISLLNDVQEESFSWSEPQDYPEFIERLALINQSPTPLPLIYLFPNSEKYQDGGLVKDKNSILISIPFKEIIENMEDWVPDLAGSEKYFKERIDEFMEVKSEEELFELIESLDDHTSKGMKSVVKKLMATFKSLIKEGILNLSDKDVPSYLTIKRKGETIYVGNPVTSIMHAQCIPSLITSSLLSQPHKDAILAYYIRKLFLENKSGSMKGKKTWLYFEELTSMVHTDPQKSLPFTEKELCNIAARGRTHGISLIYSTQAYNEIPYTIRNQTKFGIVYRHKNAELAKQICADFHLDNMNRADILTLKKHEALLVTTEQLVCYKNRKRWTEQGPIKGIVFPSLHKNKFGNKM